MSYLFQAIIAITALVCQVSWAQLFRPMLPRRNMLNPALRSQQQQSNVDYRTCIGQTAAGDEMRITFLGRASTPSSWWLTGTQNNNIGIKAVVNSRSIYGKFQLVTTEYGRIDGMCESESLGNIINKRNIGVIPGVATNQQKKRIGWLGDNFELSPGKSVKITDNINSRLNLDVISGGGVALCPIQQIEGNRCNDLISLCCAISKDTRPADAEVNAAPFDNNIAMNGGNSFRNSGAFVNNNGMSNGNRGFNSIDNSGMVVNPAVNGNVNANMNGGVVIGNSNSRNFNQGMQTGNNMNNMAVGPMRQQF